MNAKEYVVRIVKPSPKPALPKAAPSLKLRSRKKRLFLEKTLNILAGSGIGFAAGMAIYLTLKAVGVNFGGLESSVIIGLPSVLGVITSFTVY